MQPGPRNHLLDVAGLALGHAESPQAKSGSTAIVAEPACVGSVAVYGGAPGTRETDLLAPEQTMERIDAIVLSGGSAFGLAAADGAQAALAARGRGYPLPPFTVPIVPAAIIADLTNGGDKDWGFHAPYRELGTAAVEASGTSDTRIGTVGAGSGAMVADLKGGLGSASCRLPSGATVAALVIVNAIGRVTIGATAHFRAALFELGDEFGGLGLPASLPADSNAIVTKRGALTPAANTVVAVVATDAALSKAQARRLAIAAQDGIGLAVWPAHTPFDGDTVFSLATGQHGAPVTPTELAALGAAAAATLARAICRGVFAAMPAPGDMRPTWAMRAAAATVPPASGG